jgi:hypothetical protein
LEEYQEQAFLYASAIADMIDIKDGANARHWLSSSFWHKECLSGHSVGGSQHGAPRDDDDDARILILVSKVSQIFA